MKTCAGKLNCYIELQTDSNTQDSFGEDVETWSTLANVWAERMNQSVAEKWTGEQYAGKRTVTWRIRWRSDVDNLDRVVYDGENYGIIGVIETGRREDLLLVTEAILDR